MGLEALKQEDGSDDNSVNSDKETSSCPPVLAVSSGVSPGGGRTSSRATPVPPSKLQDRYVVHKNSLFEHI